MKENKNLTSRFILFLLMLMSLVMIYLLLKQYGLIDLITDTETFKSYVNGMGLWGIILIISLMSFAILFKLLPSAAIALVSGAVYGHTWGTIYIIIGAWIGAIIAFSITRILGKDAIFRLSGRRVYINEEHSQSWLMWGLFISRLIPIIPYDLMSYAMGLTPLKLWRFSMATLIGVIPTSFLLAHIGGELVLTDITGIFNGMIITILLLIIPVIILLIVIIRNRKFIHRIFLNLFKEFHV